MYASNRPEDLEPAVITLGGVLATVMLSLIVLLSGGFY